MHWWKAWRSNSRAVPADEVFNSGLDCMLDFDHWLGPVQQQLQKRYPHLSEQQLDHANSACSAAVLWGLELALSLGTAATVQDVEQAFVQQFQARYPQASAANCARVFRHCMYYATKTSRLS